VGGTVFLGTRTGQRTSARRRSAALRLMSLGGITVLTVTGASLAPGAATARSAAAALTEPVPSDRDVARAERRARERAEEVAQAKVRYAQAAGELERLAAAAALAVERYNGEKVRLAQAAGAYQDAMARLAEAERRYAQARANLAAFAAEAYRAGSGSTPWPSVIAGSGGAQGAMDRAGLLEMLARRRTGFVQEVQAARNVADLFRTQAQSALAEQHAATQRALQARRAAEEAVARQQRAVQEIGAEKRRLERELDIARERADDLARRRREALRDADAAGSGSGYSQGLAVARAALRWLGTPYSWGGGTVNGPSYGIAHGARIYGFDCSGLAMYAWAKAGVHLDHWTGTQWTSGPHIPLNRLRPGDLVFYAYNTSDPGTIHHVGVYIGKGRMVEAPYTGGRVRISSIWRPGLIGATRPAG